MFRQELPALLLAGGAEVVGHQRLGLLPRWPKVVALLAGWTLAGALAWYAGHVLEVWLNPSVIVSGEWLDSSATAIGYVWVTALQGFLLAGMGSGLSSYLLADRGESASRASWRRASRLAWPLLFAVVCGSSAAEHARQDIFYYPPPTGESVVNFPLFLALAATAAGYLGRRDGRGESER